MMMAPTPTSGVSGNSRCIGCQGCSKHSSETWELWWRTQQPSFRSAWTLRLRSGQVHECVPPRTTRPTQPLPTRDLILRFGFLRDSVALWLNGFLHGTRRIQTEAAVRVDSGASSESCEQGGAPVCGAEARCNATAL